MLFGDEQVFAIEIDDLSYFEGKYYCQFRFWTKNIPIGDWDDRIMLHTSVVYMKEFLETESLRLSADFLYLNAEGVFLTVHDAYYNTEWDPAVLTVDIPDLRARFHLEDIGMSALVDKYAIVLVAGDATCSRLIVKSYRDDTLSEFILPFGEVERIGRLFVDWGSQLLDHHSVS